ncbi:hypothetical protein K443DRAFT_682552 [Laccaria amethystina LaAM-08-1]|uniref:Uncharacterized protein n=1 Tax=Laccaria amethystina LaAM-08-1 TaxID=1095629 RepID=A0A0C9X490_9AGAR|nr:hypothetical protein K443DRAFT_682552 [Laccaria amethystina LaAM-08-1]
MTIPFIVLCGPLQASRIYGCIHPRRWLPTSFLNQFMHIRNLHLLNLLVEDAFPSSDKRLRPSRIASATPLTLSNPNEDLLQALAKFASHPNTSLDFSLLQYISVENPDSDDCPLPHGLADIIRKSSKNLESSSHGPHSLLIHRSSSGEPGPSSTVEISIRLMALDPDRFKEQLNVVHLFFWKTLGLPLQ